MIDDDFLAECRTAQKDHIADLSRPITVGFEDTQEVNCPNCTYDGATGSSGAIYTAFSGTLTLFSGTAYVRTVTATPFNQRCPICKGVGFLYIPNELTIVCHVYWLSAATTYPDSPVGWLGQNTVKLKTNTQHYGYFVRAKYFVVDGVRVTPYTTPITRSVKLTEGVVEIMCRTTEPGRETRQ